MLLAILAGTLSAQSPRSVGEEHFLRNEPVQAIPFLIRALESEPTAGALYVYLGTAHLQLGQYSEALDVFRRGIESAADRTVELAMGEASVHFALSDYGAAASALTSAIEANRGSAPAYLNRGNAYVQLGRYEDAAADYRFYLMLQPNSPQAEQLGRLISLLDQRIAEAQARREEEARLAREEEARRQEEARIAREEEALRQEEARLAQEAENERRREEEERAAQEAAAEAEARAVAEAERAAEEERRRQEEEARIAAEEARRQQLLSSVLDSLDSAQDESINLSAGRENVEDVDAQIGRED